MTLRKLGFIWLVGMLAINAAMLSLVLLAERGIYVEPIRSVAQLSHFITDYIPINTRFMAMWVVVGFVTSFTIIWLARRADRRRAA